jgi:hypothetical protein
MTKNDIKIEVISKLTGDSRLKVTAIVNLMNDLMEGQGEKFVDEKITPAEANALRRKLKKDNELIDWYKKGLHYCQILRL